jgi:rubrerythrin
MTVDNQEVMSPAEALAIGIQAEKDSILLYQGIFNQSKSQAVRNALSILLEEEKRHLVELREHLEEMQENETI